MHILIVPGSASSSSWKGGEGSGHIKHMLSLKTLAKTRVGFAATGKCRELLHCNAPLPECMSKKTRIIGGKMQEEPLCVWIQV